ncbi:MAG: thioesterase family protein [Spirochaetales bacterium]
MNFPGVVVGNALTLPKTVSESHTADNFFDTGVEKLCSTPSLVSMMMEASVGLIDPTLPDGFVSVGKSASVTHEQPTVLGANLRLEVRITDFDGYHIYLEMTAWDDSGLVGRGQHVRSIVNRRWLELKVNKRLMNL